MARRAWIGVGAAAVVVVITGGLLVIRYTNGICTAIGCFNTVSFDLRSVNPDTLRAATSVRLCANDVCTTSPLVADQRFVPTMLGERTVRTASVSIMGASGEQLAAFTLPGEVEADESMPNGPRCEPTCWQLTLALADGSLRPQSLAERTAPGTTTR
jgi:hypothetical protein